MKDVISMQDFSKKEILYILDTAADVKKAIHDVSYNKEFKTKYNLSVSELLKNCKIGTLFVENSTRTNYSFRAAAMAAGAIVDGFPTPDYTSLKKGETWADTVAMFAGYGFDAIVMRSTTEGLPRWTKEVLQQNNNHLQQQHQLLNLPYSYHTPVVINGGDGKNQHPTQCLLDLFTMRELANAHNKELDGLEIALLNDLKYGRTIASLMSVAHHFDFKLHLAYPNRFGPQQHRLDDLLRKNIKIYNHHENFEEALRTAFIAYHSRPQKERIGQGEDFENIKLLGQIKKSVYDKLGNHAPYLMHPLPVDAEHFAEIHADMNFHPKNVTKLQSSNGIYVRIALLALGLDRINCPYKSTEKELTETNLIELPLINHTKELSNPISGYIQNGGIVLDHIPAGMGRRLAGVLGLEHTLYPKVIADYLPSPKTDGKKDIIKIHAPYEFSPEQYKAMALIAPNITVSRIKQRQVAQKFRPILGNYIKDHIKCRNDTCVTNDKKEPVTYFHHVHQQDKEIILRCHYCEQTDTLPNIYKENRFIYIGEEKK